MTLVTPVPTASISCYNAGGASLSASVRASAAAVCRAAERRDDMVGLLHTKGYSRVIDMTGEEKNGRRVSQHPVRAADHLHRRRLCHNTLQLQVSCMQHGPWPYASWLTPSTEHRPSRPIMRSIMSGHNPAVLCHSSDRPICSPLPAGSSRAQACWSWTASTASPTWPCRSAQIAVSQSDGSPRWATGMRVATFPGQHA